MKKLDKCTKKELINEIKDTREDLQEALADIRNAQKHGEISHDLQMKAEKSLQAEKEKSQRFSNQLSDVRKSIQTVLRMKYPDRNISSSNDMSMLAKPETDEAPVNEELNLLHYIMDLAQPSMTASEALHKYRL